MGDTENTGRASEPAVRKAARVLMFGVAVALALGLGGWALLRSRSPGVPMPVLGVDGRPVPGSISEKIFVDIGGVRQGMFIRSADPANPVLLFVHGGPGMPEYFLDELYPTGLESRFTVCWWEQRGAGLSYSPGMDPGTLTVDRLVSDVLEATDYLRSRFGKDKIYLLGHSWGSFLAIKAADRAPEKFLAYIGVAQVADQTESEKRAYAYMLDRYMEAGNEKKLRKLWKYPILESGEDVLLSYMGSLLRDETMHELGIGTTRTMKSVITGVFLPVWRSRAYTLREKADIWKAKAFLARSTDLRSRLLTARPEEEILSLDIPAYFLSGRHDLTVSRDLSRRYLGKLAAPVKGFYTLEDSAHSPMFEEPKKFLRILTEDVLAGTVNLADRD
ncbi:MAG TPA: alpha/beta fold hydrolase [Spirochaetia bacterium]|nr:alpha/beta fold hydrolase [Spirochaetales bacterium]HRY80281.1 alpha/beta fold hydrolase [Spirochaetia bacterium]HRZ89412.1 alpha/beta fold hydrolase [Spirochaetia bacterium]